MEGNGDWFSYDVAHLDILIRDGPSAGVGESHCDSVSWLVKSG